MQFLIKSVLVITEKRTQVKTTLIGSMPSFQLISCLDSLINYPVQNQECAKVHFSNNFSHRLAANIDWR